MYVENWKPGDWVLVMSRYFDGCRWALSGGSRRTPGELHHWCVIVNVRPQTYRGRKNRRGSGGEGPVIEVECPAVPIDRVCRFGCGAISRRAHTHNVRASRVLEYRPGVQTVERIEVFLDPF